MKQNVIYNNPPTHCQVCEEPIESVFYDCVVRAYKRTAWANVCPQCFERYGVGLGTGLGQKYQQELDGKYRKVAG